MPNQRMSPLEADVQAAIEAPDDELRAWRRKDRIERYWRGRGRIVRVRVVEQDIALPGGETVTIFTLSSDMVNGMPAREVAR